MDLINNLVFNNELETLRRETRRLQQENRKLIESQGSIKIDPKYNYSYAFYHKQVSDLNGYNMNKCQATNSMFESSQINENFNFDTSKWTLSNLVNADFMFSGLQLNENSNFNTSNLDLSNLLRGDYMFNNLKLNEKSNFDTSKWSLSNLMYAVSMFSGLLLNEKSKFDTSNWDLSNLVGAYSMFSGSNIKELNFSSWNNANKLDNTSNMFYVCSKLTKLTAYGSVLKKLTENASEFDIDENTLYTCEGEVKSGEGLFTIVEII